MEHPPEIEGLCIYRVPFVRVSCQSEPVESSSTEPNCKRRKAVGPMVLPELLSLAVHIVSWGGYLPLRNRRGLPPPSPIVGQVVNCQEVLRVVSICRL